MLAHSIQHARDTPAITRVIVTTDDPESTRIASQYGAEVIQLPTDVSSSAASAESDIIYGLDHLREREDYEPDLIVLLQSDLPFRKPDDTQIAIEALMAEQADSLFSASPVSGPAWRRDGNNLISARHEYNAATSTDSVSNDLIENGSIYIFKPHVLRRYNRQLGGKIAVHLMPLFSSLRVDEEADIAAMEDLLSVATAETREIPDLSHVVLLVLDFDGVLTDNRVLVDQSGHEAVWCHRGDGWGIARVRDAGVKVLVLSTESNPVVRARCMKLQVDSIQGCDNKLEVLQQQVRALGLEASEVVYVGNDINDLGSMRWVGVPIAVADAVYEVKEQAVLVTMQSGGHGAVREVCDMILTAKGLL